MSIPISLAHLSNQSNLANSVIQQPNQPSVIQTTGGATVQSVQLPKNVILINKIIQGSVIQSTENNEVQLINNRLEGGEESNVICSTLDEDSKKRRELLARRPSYRKILNEISSAESGGIIALDSVKSEPNESNQAQLSSSQTGGLGLNQTRPNLPNTTDHNNNETDAQSSPLTVGSYLKVIPTSTMQLSSNQDLNLPALQLPNSNPQPGQQQAHSGIVQYTTQCQDGQLFVPDVPWHYRVSAADLQAYQLRGAHVAPSVMINSNNTTGNPQHQIAEEAAKKRELRLLKNREAAKECRRKKKEYIKCLENRVNVLEAQNKALIDELKSLKELYCQKMNENTFKSIAINLIINY